MAAPTIRGSTAAAAGLSATSPASTQVDDLVIVGTWERAGAGVPTHTLQSGFTELRTHSHNDGSTDGRLSFAYKIATSSGATSYQAYTSDNGTSVWTGILVLTAGTFNAVAPLFASNSSTLTTNAVPNPPSVTLTTSRDFLVLAIGAWHLGSVATVAITAPTNYTETWEMAGSNLGEFSVASRSLTAPASEDPGAFTDDVAPNGSVSMTLAFGNVLAFDRTAAADGAGDIATAATFFTTFERAVAAGATGDIATIGEVEPGVTIHERAVSADAVGGIAAVPQRDLMRSSATSATADVAATGRRDLLRSSATGASAAITTAGQRDLIRSSAVNATASVTTAPQRDLIRQIAIDAVGGIATSGVLEHPAVERSIAADATAAITAAGQRDLIRSIAVASISDVASTGQRDLLRAIASSASTAASTSAMRDVLRAAGIAGTAGIAAAPQRDVLRAVAIDTIGGIATSGLVEGPAVERSASLSVDAVISCQGDRVVQRAAGLVAAAAIVVHVPGEHMLDNIGEGWLGPYRARGWLREYRGGVD